MAVARCLEDKMKEFRDSLPLFGDLKHEALRDRHWKELMVKTGQKFEMNPDTFTLANIFAMELHRYRDTIAEIVTCASKEMGIEKVRNANPKTLVFSSYVKKFLFFNEWQLNKRNLGLVL